MKSRVAVLVACVLVAVGGTALAQTEPTPAPNPTTAPAAASRFPAIPPAVGSAVTNFVLKLAGDASAGYGVDPNHIRGAVTYFQRFDLQIRMPMNQYRNIVLHQGTVINPRGGSIQTGQTLDVQGHPNPDGTMEADTITILH